jgi:hypothetical protein
VCDGHVLEVDVELLGAAEEVAADAVADCFTLGDEFCGVELGDDGFEDFVADGGEDTLVVILSEVLQHMAISSTLPTTIPTNVPGRSLAASSPRVYAGLSVSS